jgi:hypothetical protein
MVEVTIDPLYECLILPGLWFDKLLTYTYRTNRRTRLFDSALMMIMKVLLMVMLMIVEPR